MTSCEALCGETWHVGGETKAGEGEENRSVEKREGEGKDGRIDAGQTTCAERSSM